MNKPLSNPGTRPDGIIGVGVLDAQGRISCGKLERYLGAISQAWRETRREFHALTQEPMITDRLKELTARLRILIEDISHVYSTMIVLPDAQHPLIKEALVFMCIYRTCLQNRLTMTETIPILRSSVASQRQ